MSQYLIIDENLRPVTEDNTDPTMNNVLWFQTLQEAENFILNIAKTQQQVVYWSILPYLQKHHLNSGIFLAVLLERYHARIATGK
jgi:hypothetical protein